MALLDGKEDFAALRIGAGPLTLRPPVLADADRLTDLIGDYEVTKWLSQVPWPYRRDHALKWLAQCAEPGGRSLALAIDAGEGLVGAISLAGLDDEPELGYWLGREYWGKGYMTLAFTAFLAYAFDTLEVPSVRSTVFEHNLASLRLQERAGFRVFDRVVHHSLARGNAVPGVLTRLTREDYNAAGRADAHGSSRFGGP